MLVAIALSGCVNIPVFHGAASDAAPGDGARGDGAPLDGPADAPKPPIDFSAVDACPAMQVPGLLSYLPLNEGAGTAAGDVSDNHHDASVVGGWDVGRLGSSVALNGTTDVVVFDQVPPFDHMVEVSVCAWVYPNIIPGTGGAATIADKSYDGTLGGWNAYVQESSGIQVPGFFTNYRAYALGSTAIPIQTWTHVCTTWNGTAGTNGIKLYHSGALETVGFEAPGETQPDLDMGTPLALGRAGGSKQYFLNGRLDDVAIFNRVLSAAEVLAIYQCAP